MQQGLRWYVEINTCGYDQRKTLPEIECRGNVMFDRSKEKGAEWRGEREGRMLNPRKTRH